MYMHIYMHVDVWICMGIIVYICMSIYICTCLLLLLKLMDVQIIYLISPFISTVMRTFINLYYCHTTKGKPLC